MHFCFNVDSIKTSCTAFLHTVSVKYFHCVRSCMWQWLIFQYRLLPSFLYFFTGLQFKYCSRGRWLAVVPSLFHKNFQHAASLQYISSYLQTSCFYILLLPSLCLNCTCTFDACFIKDQSVFQSISQSLSLASVLSESVDQERIRSVGDLSVVDVAVLRCLQCIYMVDMGPDST